MMGKGCMVHVVHMYSTLIVPTCVHGVYARTRVRTMVEMVLVSY
jgi:hypothetical protein